MTRSSSSRIESDIMSQEQVNDSSKLRSPKSVMRAKTNPLEATKAECDNLIVLYGYKKTHDHHQERFAPSSKA